MGKILIPKEKIHIRTIQLIDDYTIDVAKIDEELASSKDFIDYCIANGVEEREMLEEI